MKSASFLSLLFGGHLLLTVLPVARAADERPAEGGGDSGRHALDFWVGEWEVYDNGSRRLDGCNRIEPVLKGAAIIEHWSGANGSEGKSWFYFYRPEERWKQIWVTDGGFVKEKAQVSGAAAGSVRFQGEIPLKDGHKLLDRTTLTPQPDGRVRQVIEHSRDAGATWQTVYDASYIRKAGKS